LCSSHPSPCFSSNFEIGSSILNCVSLQAVHLMARSFSVDLPYFLRARVLRLYYALNHSCDPPPFFRHLHKEDNDEIGGQQGTSHTTAIYRRF
jgi:hypothetical protein